MILKLSKESIFRVIQRIQILMMFFLAFLFADIVSIAREKEQDKAKEIVVVLDCSKSMEDVDGQYLAFDFAKGIMASIPREYKMGMVAYNDEVCISLPIGCSYEMLEYELNNVEYKHYGNAGVGLEAAVKLFGSGQAEKKIILISDGEILMDTEDETEESKERFLRSVELSKKKNITVDVLALGERKEEGYTVYSAADETGGRLYELRKSEELITYLDKYLFDEWGISGSHIGKLNGTNGELAITLPDCYMESAKIVLLGKQQNENLIVNCEVDKINVLKGKNYTIIELKHPNSEQVKIQILSEEGMEIDAYLIADYEYEINTGYTYEPITQKAEIWLMMTNPKDKKLFDGHLKNGGMTIYLNGEEQDYEVVDGKAYIEKIYTQDAEVKIEVAFDKAFGNYYGIASVENKIIVPIVEEEPEQIDWFFWSVIIIFVIALITIFVLAGQKRKRFNIKKRVIDESISLPKERGIRSNDFYGKIVVYVIHNKEDIDYPPESINLFARCNREMITLEWILDTCNLPFDLKGAERIVFKPGADRSLIIKNNSKASVLLGRELLLKGHSYPLYYHEKVTFIFDQEDTEIEVHYKDLKPNER